MQSRDAPQEEAPTRATEAYSQGETSPSSPPGEEDPRHRCDDGSRGYTHGDTLEYTDPDGNNGSVEQYGDRTYQHDDDGNSQVCTQIGSTVTCE